MAETTITVVTPWVDATELAPGYWHAVRSLDDRDDLIVIDNGSVPPLEESWADTVREEPTTGVTFVRFEHNIGFGRACNIGLDRAETDAVLFLNNDIRATDPTWLDPIRKTLRPGALVGAQLRADPHTAVNGTPIPYLDGWCLAGMRDDLVNIGGWNEEFEEPAYYGDNELCVRARAAGMDLAEVQTGLVHIGNYTSKRMDVTGVSARNRALYERAARNLAP